MRAVGIYSGSSANFTATTTPIADDVWEQLQTLLKEKHKIRVHKDGYQNHFNHDRPYRA